MSERIVKTHVLANTDLSSILEPDEFTSRPAECKVIGTLGPSCRDLETLVAMLDAGMTAARIDLTWGSVEYHKQSLRNLREACQRTKRMCAVILDTVGRELMISRDFTLDHEGWPVHKEGFDIKSGQQVTVTTCDKAEASSSVLPISYAYFAHMCQPGDTLFIGRYLVNGADQSSLYLEVKEVYGNEVRCTALNDAHMDGLLTVIHSEKGGDGMSSMQTDLPLLTDHDEEAIKTFIKEFEIDYINLTYTCSGMDVYEMREFLDEHNGENIKIIAKVETLEALHNFDSIAGAADAIILSRGNLGLDVAPEKTAVVQKAAINRCNLLGRPVIITRLVDSMAEAPRCTRAEATDVANAVLDGVDGMLLGAETLRGKYPVETLRTVLAICRQAELAFDHESHFDKMMARAMQDDEADMMLDSSHHHGDFLSPPGGHSPDVRSAAKAQSISETLACAADAVSHGAADSPTTNGVHQDGGHFVQPGLPPIHPRTPNSAMRTTADGHSGDASPSFSASGPPALRLSSSSSRVSSFGTLPRAMSTAASLGHTLGEAAAASDSRKSEYSMSKVESIASTAVRAAAKMKAGLIICYAGTGRTASLVAKYRPNVPILTLVVPQLKSKGLAWELEGRSLARQFLIMRGLIPMLAAPMAGASDSMLNQVLNAAVKRDLVKAKQHVVCVLSSRGDLVLNVCQVDERGAGLKSNLASLELVALGSTSTADKPAVTEGAVA